MSCSHRRHCGSYIKGRWTVLAIHEEIFHGGQRLPHRDLDELIMRKIDQGEWLVADRREYLEDSDWILLRTRQ